MKGKSWDNQTHIATSHLWELLIWLLKMTVDILQIKNLSCGYGKTPTLENINFEVATGEWLSIIGANGCGKSTLLKTICGLLLPQNGSILLNGKNILHSPAISRYMAFLPQQPISPEGLTVYQMVCLGETSSNMVAMADRSTGKRICRESLRALSAYSIPRSHCGQTLWW